MEPDFYTYNSTSFEVLPEQISGAGCGGWTCTIVLLVMGQARY